MNLREELSRASDYQGKWTLLELERKLRAVAEQGKREFFIESSSAFQKDIDRLSDRGLYVESDGHGWLISW